MSGLTLPFAIVAICYKNDMVIWIQTVWQHDRGPELFGTKHENDDYSDNHAIHQLIVTVIIKGQRVLITFY